MDGEYHILAPDATFDIVYSLNCLEHVRQPWTWITELARLLRPGGTLIIVTPVSWQEHRSPYDCWRVFPDGARALFEMAGIEPLLVKMETLDHSPESRRHQMGRGPVVDLIAIGRKSCVAL